MVNIGLPSDIVVALLDLCLGCLILLSNVSFSLLSLSKLNFNVAQRILQLLVFNFAQAQHLLVLNLCAFLTLDSEASTDNSLLLQ